MKYECRKWKLYITFYPTYMDTHCLLFYRISSLIICSQGKLVISLKTIRKCCKFCERENMFLFRILDPWPQVRSMSSGPLWSACLSAPSASQLSLLLNISICSFLPNHRFYPICILKTFSNDPLSSWQSPNFQPLNRLHCKSYKPICLCVPTQTVCSNQISMTPVPQTHTVFTCTFAHVTFPRQDITSSVCASQTLTHTSKPSLEFSRIIQAYWNPSLKTFITGNTDFIFGVLFKVFHVHFSRLPIHFISSLRAGNIFFTLKIFPLWLKHIKN